MNGSDSQKPPVLDLNEWHTHPETWRNQRKATKSLRLFIYRPTGNDGAVKMQIRRLFFGVLDEQRDYDLERFGVHLVHYINNADVMILPGAFTHRANIPQYSGDMTPQDAPEFAQLVRYLPQPRKILPIGTTAIATAYGDYLKSLCTQGAQKRWLKELEWHASFLVDPDEIVDPDKKTSFFPSQLWQYLYPPTRLDIIAQPDRPKTLAQAFFPLVLHDPLPFKTIMSSESDPPTEQQVLGAAPDLLAIQHLLLSISANENWAEENGKVRDLTSLTSG